jgi:hypothetical protein
MPICLNKERVTCRESDRAVDHINITSFCSTSVGNIDGTAIHLLRQPRSWVKILLCRLFTLNLLSHLVT